MTRYLDWSTKKLQRHQQQIKLVLDSRATDYSRDPALKDMYPCPNGHAAPARNGRFDWHCTNGNTDITGVGVRCEFSDLYVPMREADVKKMAEGSSLRQVAVEPERYDGGSRWIVWSPLDNTDVVGQKHQVPAWAVVITGITMNTIDRREDRIHVTQLTPPTWEAHKGSYHTDIPRGYLDKHAERWTPEEFKKMARAVKGLRE